MIVANSFDLWQKDAFFSAAEEVQESADRLESTYRRWARERIAGLATEDLDELCRELQTALGTAKWQLEEFDRAVRLTHRGRSEDTTTARHKEFVAALENQISRIEGALREYFNQNGRKSLQWVNLDEEERADLAMFLAGTSGATSNTKNENVEDEHSTRSMWLNQYGVKDSEPNCNFNVRENDSEDEKKGLEEATVNKDGNYVIELNSKDISTTRDDINSQSDRSFGSRRTWSSPNFGALKIIIPDDDEQRKALRSRIEAAATPKEKGFKPAVWNLSRWWREYAHIKGRLPSYLHWRGTTGTNQLFGHVGFQRPALGAQHLQFTCSLQVMLVLMLTMFLIVPFVLYST